MKFNELSRNWNIYLVHHTHTDLGYTELQDTVERKHAEYIAQVLDYCTETDNLPRGEKFCWTCETSWSIKLFLQRFPERANEFFARVREGRIEVTALYLQLTDIFSYDLLEETTNYALNLAQQHDFEIVTAMNNDVNGWAWGLPDMLSKRGVRYMDTAINETRALGVRPRPAFFRWIGPQNGALLFWHSDGYLTGNSLLSESKMATFLKNLENKGYPHNSIAIRIQGAAHDNAPPGLWLCKTVRRWNESFNNPKLYLVTARQWFEHASKRWSSPIPEFKAAWPDWWSDGSGSATNETKLVRKAQANLESIKRLAKAQCEAPPELRYKRAQNAAIYFSEHTWGAWCSTDDPSHILSVSQWNSKAAHAYRAALESDALIQDMLALKNQKPECPVIRVFNPLNQTRSDIVELIVADEDLGFEPEEWIKTPIRTTEGPDFHLFDTQSGAHVPVEREPAIADSARRPAQKIRFIAKDMPSNGFKTFTIVKDKIALSHTGQFDGSLFSFNGIDITLATDGAGISAIRGERFGKEFKVTDNGYSLGEPIYETVPGEFGRERLCGWDGIIRNCPFERTNIRFVSVNTHFTPDRGMLQLSTDKLPGSLSKMTLNIVVHNKLPRIDLLVMWLLN
ncbi:MAG: hypothetical protein GX811_07465, partial [Lentisphaerae bacterium]|nr:hypothetical protein [Lentisphaerota bacterium]